MSRSRTFVLAFGFVAASAVLVHAAGSKFNVKPGLWQVTMTGSANGAPPIPADTLARLTPEQRARLEAAMQAAMARSGAPRTFQSCITEKEIERGLDFTDPQQKSCRQTVVTRTATVMEVHVECTGKETMTGTFRYQASSPESVNGSSEMVFSDGTKTMTAKHSMQGKWLGADCGAVKPSDPE